MKKGIVLVVTTIILLFGITGCTEDENATVSGTNKESSKKVDAKKEFQQNETAMYKNVEYTITNVERSNGSEWDKPADGKEYVIVSIKIENKSKEKISYNPYDWKMQNSNGQEDTTCFTTIDNDTRLNSGDLVSGGIKEGTVTFEEPTGDNRLKLNYYGNMFDSNYAFQIKLG